MEDVEELAFVFVEPLHLHVKDGVGVDLDAVMFPDVFCQFYFVFPFDLRQFLEHFLIACEGEHFFQIVQIAHPVFADLAADEFAETGVCLAEPAAGGDAVGHIDKLAGIEVRKVFEEPVLEQFGVERCHAVDMPAGNDAHVRHPHHFFVSFLNERHSGEAVVVADVACCHIAEEAEVDLVDDLQMPGQEFFHESDGPLFQRLGHEGVVGVVEGLADDVPGFIPREVFFVDEEAHEFGDRQSRVCIVELDDTFAVEVPQVFIVIFHSADDVLQRCGDEEELLFEAQFLAFVVVVVGVQHARDVLAHGRFQVRADVIALIELDQIEAVEGFRRPETQGVDRVVLVAGNGGIVGHGKDILGADPLAAAGGGIVRMVFHFTAEMDDAGKFGAADLPGVAAAEPVIRFFQLVTVLDDLLEDPVVVADAVSVAGEFQSCHGIEEACGETAEAAVSESGVHFFIAERIGIESEFRHGFRGGIIDAEVDHGIPEGSAHEEFQRDIGDGAGMFFLVFIFGSDPALHHQVADRQRQCVITVQIHRLFRAFAQGACQMPLEGFQNLVFHCLFHVWYSNSIAFSVLTKKRTVCSASEQFQIFFLKTFFFVFRGISIPVAGIVFEFFFRFFLFCGFYFFGIAFQNFFFNGGIVLSQHAFISGLQTGFIDLEEGGFDDIIQFIVAAHGILLDLLEGAEGRVQVAVPVSPVSDEEPASCAIHFVVLHALFPHIFHGLFGHGRAFFSGSDQDFEHLACRVTVPCGSGFLFLSHAFFIFKRVLDLHLVLRELHFCILISLHHAAGGFLPASDGLGAFRILFREFRHIGEADLIQFNGFFFGDRLQEFFQIFCDVDHALGFFHAGRGADFLDRLQILRASAATEEKVVRLRRIFRLGTVQWRIGFQIGFLQALHGDDRSLDDFSFIRDLFHFLDLNAGSDFDLLFRFSECPVCIFLDIFPEKRLNVVQFSLPLQCLFPVRDAVIERFKDPACLCLWLIEFALEIIQAAGDFGSRAFCSHSEQEVCHGAFESEVFTALKMLVFIIQFPVTDFICHESDQLQVVLRPDFIDIFQIVHLFCIKFGSIFFPGLPLQTGDFSQVLIEE